MFVRGLAARLTGGVFGHRHPDPTTFIEGVAVWAAINAAAMFWSGPEIVHRPGFAMIRALHISAPALAFVFGADALLLIVSVLGASLAMRSTVALLSALIWTLYGLSVVFAFSEVGGVSIIGLYSIACGIGCMNAVSQWVYAGDRNG